MKSSKKFSRMQDVSRGTRLGSGNRGPTRGLFHVEHLRLPLNDENELVPRGTSLDGFVA